MHTCKPLEGLYIHTIPITTADGNNVKYRRAAIQHTFTFVYIVSFAKTTHIKHKNEEKKTSERPGERASEREKNNILIRRGTTVKR